MDSVKTTLILFVIFLVLSIFSGIQLSRKGQPYPNGILTIHKIISIVYVILSVLIINNLITSSEINTGGIISLVIFALFVVFSVVSGGILSAGKSMQSGMAFFHRITYFLIVIFSIIAGIMAIKQFITFQVSV